MGVIAQFDAITFEISEEQALLLKELKISAEAETEDKTENEQKYVEYKNGKPAEVNFDVDIMASLGNDVRQIVTLFLHSAQRGKTEYFYVGGEKIFPAKVMMTKAEASETEIGPKGTWIRSKIAVTLKQAEKNYIIPDPEAENNTGGGGDGGGGNGSSKASVKTNAAVITYNVNGYTEYYYTTQSNAASAQAAANAATAKAASTVSTAKTTTSSVTKTTSSTTKVTTSGGGGGR